MPWVTREYEEKKMEDGSTRRVAKSYVACSLRMKDGREEVFVADEKEKKKEVEKAIEASAKQKAVNEKMYPRKKAPIQ